MVQLPLVPAAPRPRSDLLVHRRHLHAVHGGADARRAGRTDGGGVGGRADRRRLQARLPVGLRRPTLVAFAALASFVLFGLRSALVSMAPPAVGLILAGVALYIV